MFVKALVFLALIIGIVILWSKFSPQQPPRDQQRSNSKPNSKPKPQAKAHKNKPLARTLVECPVCATFYDPTAPCPNCK